LSNVKTNSVVNQKNQRNKKYNKKMKLLAQAIINWFNYSKNRLNMLDLSSATCVDLKFSTLKAIITARIANTIYVAIVCHFIKIYRLRNALKTIR